MIVSNIRSAPTFKQTVVIIDDQPTVLDIHAAIIKSININLNIISMTNPADALAYISKRHVDLIITDFSIMQLSAPQFVKTFTDANDGHLMPIIVISLHQDKKMQAELVASGAAAYLTKPANLHDLSKTAYSLLKASSQLFKTNQVLVNANGYI